MAEVDTSVYKTLGQNNQQMSPLQVLQFIGAANQNKLFQQTYDSRQAIGDAYKNNVDPQGNINNRGLIHDIAGNGGFLAGEGVGTAQGNATTQLSNQVAQQKYLQSTVGSLAALPNPTMRDVNNWAVSVARNTNAPPEMIQGLVDGAYAAGNDPKALKKYLATQGIFSMGTGALSGEAGPPDPATGQPQNISAGEGILNRAGVGPGSKGASPAPIQTGMPTGMPAGFDQAAGAIGAQSGASANALTQANDTSMTRKGMLGNLEDDLGKFTAGPGADWTKLAKSWVNRNVPMPKGWQFDPASIASQEQFNKQAMMLAQQQFQTIGGTGTDAKFNSAFTTSPNELLSDLGNKGIIRLLKGNEDAIQAKNSAWQQWRAAGNGPQTYQDFSSQFNQHFDPRAFQFKYLPTAQDRQEYVNKMDPDERTKFLQDLTYARKQGWINFQQPSKQGAITFQQPKAQ